jgi:hypothetical protein
MSPKKTRTKTSKGGHMRTEDILYQPPERVLDIVDEMAEIRQLEKQRCLFLDDDSAVKEKNKKAHSLFYSIGVVATSTLLWIGLLLLLTVFVFSK